MIKLKQGNCLELMPQIPSGSVDMILCDLPYGTTACKWDTVIPFEPLWAEYKRIIKKNGAIVLFGAEPFSSHLRMLNMGWFKYDWYWEKNLPSGVAYAKTQPMRVVENVLVFCEGVTCFNKQLADTIISDRKIVEGRKNGSGGTKGEHFGVSNKVDNIQKTKVNPRNLLKIPCVPNAGGHKLHPTQKPVALCEYLIKTYTNEGEWVMDNCMGSGTTGVACVNTNRNFIGIEQEEKYFVIAKQRITDAQDKLTGDSK